MTRRFSWPHLRGCIAGETGAAARPAEPAEAARTPVRREDRPTEPGLAQQPKSPLGVRLLRIAAGVTCLFGPLLAAAALLCWAPGCVDKLLVDYTNLYVEPFLWTVYARFTAIETLVRVYNSIGPAILLGSSAVLLSISIHVLLSRFRIPQIGRAALEVGMFLALMTAASLLYGAPAALYLAAAATTIFAMNFPLAALWLNETAPKRPFLRAAGRAAIWLGAIPGLSHLSAPTGVLVFSAGCFWPGSSKARRAAFRLGQASACLISLPLAILVIHSLQPIPVSPAARLILRTPQLYDIVIDRPANRLIVTDKPRSTIVLLSLDRLEPIGDVRLPTAELEDIEFDPESRQIYHVDRATGNVLAVDADTFRVRRVATIHEPTSAGSTKVALDKSSNHIVVSWEDNNLFSVDLATSQWTLLGRPDNVNLLADRRNELVYIDETWEPWITAMDLKNKTPPRRVRGPVVSERLVLSEKRRELYVPDPRGGKIWVYSTPDLRLVRKIRSEYTVRAVAVDDDHGLLLAASVVTGRVQVIDVETAELLQEHYVGKRCRIMQLDTPTRRAFVTLTRDGLVVLHY